MLMYCIFNVLKGSTAADLPAFCLQANDDNKLTFTPMFTLDLLQWDCCNGAATLTLTSGGCNRSARRAVAARTAVWF